jgi:hypothetical protein
MSDPDYTNIRQILGSLIGHVLVDITQHDKDEFEETRQSYVQFHFDNGEYVKIPISEDGFSHNCDEN